MQEVLFTASSALALVIVQDTHQHFGSLNLAWHFSVFICVLDQPDPQLKL